jgi:hypothetical protein
MIFFYRLEGGLIVFFAYFLDKAKVACRYLYSIFKFRGTYCIFALFFGSDFLDEIVEECAMFETAMVEANAVETADIAEFAIRETIDFLNEYVFYALLAEVKFADE